MLMSLANTEQTSKHLIGHQFLRLKSVLLNEKGSVMKTLFGTLDFNNAEYYNKVIKKNHLLSLLKEQVHMVKTAITNFNNTLIK